MIRGGGGAQPLFLWNDSIFCRRRVLHLHSSESIRCAILLFHLLAGRALWQADKDQEQGTRSDVLRGRGMDRGLLREKKNGSEAMCEGHRKESGCFGADKDEGMDVELEAGRG